MRSTPHRRHLSQLAAILVLVSALLIRPVTGTPVRANHTPDPASVTIAGSLQDELGCPGDWHPECVATYLAYDGDDTVWQGVFSVPAGSYEYKAALNDSWDENYGANAQPNGANISLDLAAPTDVKFYYDHKSHWVTDNVNAIIATAAGDFQSQLGCPGDWQPDCLQSWLQDIDGDGVYEFRTGAISAGAYEVRVALYEDWATAYPATNVPFTVAADGDLVTITYNAVTNDVTVTGVTPQDHLEGSVQDVEDLVDTGSLNGGQGNALIVKLEHAIEKLDQGKPDVALNMLNAFISQVNDFVAEGTLTPEEAQALLDAVNDIIDQIMLL